MPYVSHVPGPPLDAFVDDLHYFDGPAPISRLKVLPFPSSQLIVNLGGPFQVFEGNNSIPLASCNESWGVGLWDRYHIVEWPRTVRFYGVHFKPGGASFFLRLPLSVLSNQVVPLDAIWGSFAGEVRERLNAAPTLQAGFTLLEQALLSRLVGIPHGFDLVQFAVARIARHKGDIGVRTLVDEVGISQNHLIQLFKRLVGVTPKELARFYRFSFALSLIKADQSADLTFVAHQSGFYDQSHFNKEFASLTGHSPSEYLRLRRRQAEEGQDGKIPGPLPVD